MNIKLMTAVAAATLAFAGTAQAQEQTGYVEGGYTYISVDLDGLGDAGFGAGTLRGGLNFTENFGVEVEGGFGIQDDDILGASVELDNYFAGFVTVGADVGENTRAFGRVGYGTYEFSGAGGSASADDFVYGVGLRYGFNEQHGVRFDLGGVSGDAITAGVAYSLQFGG